jgi:hypothetical protein
MKPKSFTKTLARVTETSNGRLNGPADRENPCRNATRRKRCLPGTGIGRVAPAPFWKLSMKHGDLRIFTAHIIDAGQPQGYVPRQIGRFPI